MADRAALLVTRAGGRADRDARASPILPEARRHTILRHLGTRDGSGPRDLTTTLEPVLGGIRDNGYASGTGGEFADTMGIAAPVFSREGTIVCALGVGGSFQRILAREKVIIDIVKAAAADMSRTLSAL